MTDAVRVDCVYGTHPIMPLLGSVGEDRGPANSQAASTRGWQNTCVLETAGRVLVVLFVLANVVGWTLILLPGVVKRLRHDPTPTFPPILLTRAMGRDGASNAAVLCDAVQSVVPAVVVSEAEEPNQILLKAPPGPGGDILVCWDEPSRADGSGRFYLEFSALGSGLVYELDKETDVLSAFWISVGYLREGAVEANGYAWVHVREAVLWHRFSSTRAVSDYEPKWVTETPA